MIKHTSLGKIIASLQGKHEKHGEKQHIKQYHRYMQGTQLLSTQIIIVHWQLNTRQYCKNVFPNLSVLTFGRGYVVGGLVLQFIFLLGGSKACNIWFSACVSVNSLLHSCDLLVSRVGILHSLTASAYVRFGWDTG